MIVELPAKSDYASANDNPAVRLKNTPLDIVAAPGQQVTLDASESFDPDGEPLRFRFGGSTSRRAVVGRSPG